MMKCLDANQGKLSEKCKEGREKMAAMKKEWDEACGDDMKKLCSGVAAGDHKAMHECMKKNEGKLSEKCKAQKAKMKEKWAKHGEHCENCEQDEHHGKHHENHDDDGDDGK